MKAPKMNKKHKLEAEPKKILAKFMKSEHFVLENPLVREHFVLGTFCPRNILPGNILSSELFVLGTFCPGNLCQGTHCPGTFCPRNIIVHKPYTCKKGPHFC
jgi:hypothetical protein